ncbi:SDR family oxidoreductase [Tumebacillus sp. DT12]|uniref:SDR family oxidoreductase n=1 Tax=Tumebacillus lacus TaxID=2995335 RepID=A0ABT3X243_9BACL|nr:glucose 1-dehydrogenase [Tumebacillus lacus]MCX7569635.1 SDR family oxidoreductase [Tumebacillus lacus]
MNDQHSVVLVTGAGRGIGRCVALAYAKIGARVVLAELDPQLCEETAAQIREQGGEALPVPTDLRRPEQIDELMAAVDAAYGRLDVLINNAGLSRWKSPYDLTVDEWDDILNLNLRGTFLCTREAAKRMKSQGGGRIVNISSTRALQSEPNTEAYAASKGGLLALTHALAVSLGPDKILVNAISPGWIETGDYDALRPEDHAQHPAGRVGTPDDVARACLYLTDPANDFVTGINLVLDGGMTKRMIYEE